MKINAFYLDDRKVLLENCRRCIRSPVNGVLYTGLKRKHIKIHKKHLSVRNGNLYGILYKKSSVFLTFKNILLFFS